jgi:hypothetical protein
MNKARFYDIMYLLSWLMVLGFTAVLVLAKSNWFILIPIFMHPKSNRDE